MPRVSVVVPTYNRGHLIGQALDSVLAQTYRNFEVIVVDDGSTDDTLSVLARYGDRIRVISQPNWGQGGSYARNAGIHEATGEFIAFLDSDDLWLPEKLERQIAVLDADPNLAWVYSDSEAFDGDTGRLVLRQSVNHRLYEGDVLEKLFVENFIASITLVVHRTVFEQVGDFWPSPKSTDWDMTLRIAARYPIRLVPQVLARVRLHQRRVTEGLSGKQAYNAGLSVIERAVAREPERLVPLKNRSIAQLSISTGLMLARDGRLAKARSMFARAIRLTPGNAKAHIYWLGSLIGGPALNAGIRLRRRVRYTRSIRR